MRINPVRIVDEFTKLVDIDSPSFKERQMGDYVKDRLGRLGLTVIEDGAGEAIGGNCGNIYGFLPGDSGEKPLLFCAHLDTVEPARGKKAVIEADGTIRSGSAAVLGADDLAGVAAILEALTVITEKGLPHGPIEVLFTVAEEAYCRGSAEFDFGKVVSEEAYVLDLQGPVGTAALAAPSILAFTALVRGRAAHAGFAPEKGIHAVATAADAVAMLPLGRIDGETTVNVGKISGGLSSNIVPDRCVVRGEVRSLSHDKAVYQAGLVKNQFRRSCAASGAELEFDVQTMSRAYETTPGHPVAARFERACGSLGLPVSLVKTFGGSDNNVIARHGIIGLVVACAMNNVHSREEYTTVEELARIGELTLTLMAGSA